MNIDYRTFDIKQARNLIACGFGHGVYYMNPESWKYPLLSSGKFGEIFNNKASKRDHDINDFGNESCWSIY